MSHRNVAFDLMRRRMYRAESDSKGPRKDEYRGYQVLTISTMLVLEPIPKDWGTRTVRASDPWGTWTLRVRL